MMNAVLRHFFLLMRPWTNKTHLSFEYVDELSKFVKAPVSYKFSNARDSRIVCHFKERPVFAFIVCKQVFFFLPRGSHHGAKFIHFKNFPAPAHAGEFYKNWSF